MKQNQRNCDGNEAAMASFLFISLFIPGKETHYSLDSETKNGIK